MSQPAGLWMANGIIADWQQSADWQPITAEAFDFRVLHELSTGFISVRNTLVKMNYNKNHLLQQMEYS